MKDLISIKVIEQEKSRVLRMEAGGSLKEELFKIGVGISMPCGGMGRCGKCKVRFISGAPTALPGEKKYLSPKEIEDGVRLLCMSRPDADCTIEVIDSLNENSMVAELADAGDESLESNSSEESHYGIAVDLGTTTIAAALVEVFGEGAKENTRYRIIRTASCVNSQRRFGADVISRIAAAEDRQAAEEMKNLVTKDITGLISELTKDEETCNLTDIVIAGNTTMLHLLTGKDVSGLGVYPYTPVSLEMEEIKWPMRGGISASGVSGERDNIEGAMADGSNTFTKVTLLPGISAFVGADIVSGLYYVLNGFVDGQKTKGAGNEKALFIDLGTNGEMALLDGGKIRVTSTAAGPVFEAGGISCGVASVPGAISHVDIVKIGEGPGSRSSFYYDIKSSMGNFRVRISTIEDRPPVGLCGTGVMELISELVRIGIVDETGLLAEEFFDLGFPVTEDGSIRLTQKDIRNVQMGKAAIASGIRTLMRESSDPPEVIYIAGGFGSHIDIEKIRHLKMLPAELAGRTVAVGNASLKGALKYLADCMEDEAEYVAVGRNGTGVDSASSKTMLQSIVDRAEVTQLAETANFDEAYLESMDF